MTGKEDTERRQIRLLDRLDAAETELAQAARELIYHDPNGVEKVKEVIATIRKLKDTAERVLADIRRL